MRKCRKDLHRMTKRNTIHGVRPDGSVYETCRKCWNEYQKEYKQKNEMKFKARRERQKKRVETQNSDPDVQLCRTEYLAYLERKAKAA